MDMPHDVDPQETREWVDAIDGVLEVEGADRAQFLIEQVIDRARRRGAYLPFSANTAYINTIPADRQPKMPGDPTIEEKIRNYARWNAMAMVVRANKHTNVGGHIASYASASITSGIHPPRATAAISSSSRDTLRRESTLGRSCSDVSRPSRWTISGRKSMARGSRRTRIRG